MIDYVKVENGTITGFSPRPDWRDDEGNPVTDAILVENGIYPLDYDTNKPTIDTFYQSIHPAHGFVGWEIQEDKVVVAWEIEELSLEEKKQELLNILKVEFIKTQENGYFSQTIDVKINSRREDLDNMRSLLDYMVSNNITDIQFRVYDNSFVQVTQAELSSMIDELVAFGISLYNSKWSKEQAINDAQTMDELKLITVSLS